MKGARTSFTRDLGHGISYKLTVSDSGIESEIAGHSYLPDMQRRLIDGAVLLLVHHAHYGVLIGDEEYFQGLVATVDTIVRHYQMKQEDEKGSARGDSRGSDYSVLLMYPDYLSDNYGEETFYDFVKARTPQEAVKKAQKNAYNHNKGFCNDPEDFAPLLVTAGHNYGLYFGD